MATSSENGLKEYVLSQDAPTRADIRPYFSRIGDFVSFCWIPREAFFSRRVDEYLTTYHSMKTKEVVGCKIKGISFLMEQVAKMVADGRKRMTLKSISIVARGLSEKPAELSDYQQVWQNGHDVEIEDPELQPA